jgi:hypothetical protein
MGANVSTQIQSATQIIDNESFSKCTNSNTVQQSMKGLNIELIGARCGDVAIQNKTKVNQKCDMGSIASALATASMNLNSEQTSTLGLAINVDTSVQDRSSIIKNKIEMECGNNSSIQQNIENVKLVMKPYEDSSGRVYLPDCNTIKIINDADATSQCIMKLAIDALDKSDMSKKSRQTVNFPLGFGIGIIFILLLVIGVFMFTRIRLNKRG